MTLVLLPSQVVVWFNNAAVRCSAARRLTELPDPDWFRLTVTRGRRAGMSAPASRVSVMRMIARMEKKAGL